MSDTKVLLELKFTPLAEGETRNCYARHDTPTPAQFEVFIPAVGKSLYVCQMHGQDMIDQTAVAIAPAHE